MRRRTQCRDGERRAAFVCIVVPLLAVADRVADTPSLISVRFFLRKGLCPTKPRSLLPAPPRIEERKGLSSQVASGQRIPRKGTPSPIPRAAEPTQRQWKRSSLDTATGQSTGAHATPRQLIARRAEQARWLRPIPPPPIWHAVAGGSRRLRFCRSRRLVVFGLGREAVGRVELVQVRHRVPRLLLILLLRGPRADSPGRPHQAAASCVEYVRRLLVAAKA